MSTLKVDTILKRTGTGTITVGQSGDTISIPSGATLSNQGTTVPTAFGKIGQVVVSSTTSNISTSSTSLAASGFTASITPSATTSKVLVSIAGGKGTDAGAGRVDAHIYSQTGGGGYSDLFKFIDDNNQSGVPFGQTYSGADLHTTNTTSQVDYQVYLKVNAGTVFINNDSQLTITLMEILA